VFYIFFNNALGAGSRQFESGRPDFPLPTRKITTIEGLKRQEWERKWEQIRQKLYWFLSFQIR